MKMMTGADALSSPLLEYHIPWKGNAKEFVLRMSCLEQQVDCQGVLWTSFWIRHYLHVV